MKIIIVGYGEMFKAVVLGVLSTKHEIVGVFRHDNVKYSPMKRLYNDIFRPSDDYNFVRVHKLFDIKAKSVNSDEFRQEVTRLNADIIITCSWSEKFCAQTINSPKIVSINVHPSLLPKYRGPNPYMQTILHNEKETGITFHIMDVNYDTGSILHQAVVPILDNDTGKSLKTKCCDLAGREIPILLNNLPVLIKEQQSQNEKESTYYHHITIYDSVLDFSKETSEEISRRIRALTPWLNCRIPYKNDFFTFGNWQICKETSKLAPSTIVKKNSNSVFIVCKDKKIMRFGNLKSQRPFAYALKNFYFANIIKENEKAE